jgi:hypothetical protein
MPSITADDLLTYVAKMPKGQKLQTLCRRVEFTVETEGDKLFYIYRTTRNPCTKTYLNDICQIFNKEHSLDLKHYPEVQNENRSCTLAVIDKYLGFS